MTTHTHFIVARSRNGWGVCLDADLLSEHPDAAQARNVAIRLMEEARGEGELTSLVDLSSADDD
jgi:hypothetical protein